MAFVKLALSGLDGIESSRVNMSGAKVTYDPKRISPREIVKAINDKTYFKAALIDGDAPPPLAGKEKKNCAWYRIFC